MSQQDNAAQAVSKWKLVPVEPHMGMRAAGVSALYEASAGDIEATDMEVGEAYRAMLAAAPTAPAQAASGGEVVSVKELADQVFALCESIEEMPDSAADSFALERFTAGQRFAAKQIRRGIGTWLVDERNIRRATPASAPPAGDPPAPAAAREVVEALRDYAEAAHYFVEAHDNELREAGETRESVRTRMLNAEQDLIRLGYEFGKRAALAAADAQRAQEGGE